MTVCSGARPFPGDQHSLEENARHGWYTVIEPNGALRQFCDSDCLREYYAWEFEQMQARYWAVRAAEQQRP